MPDRPTFRIYETYHAPYTVRERDGRRTNIFGLEGRCFSCRFLRARGHRCSRFANTPHALTYTRRRPKVYFIVRNGLTDRVAPFYFIIPPTEPDETATVITPPYLRYRLEGVWSFFVWRKETVPYALQ